MKQEKMVDFIDKVIKGNTKVTVDTELDHWFGQSQSGDKCQVTDISMLEIIELGFHREDLLELIEDGANFVELPDGAKFARTIRALRDNGLSEIAGELTLFAIQQNMKNGFEDASPEVVE